MRNMDCRHPKMNALMLEQTDPLTDNDCNRQEKC